MHWFVKTATGYCTSPDMFMVDIYHCLLGLGVNQSWQSWQSSPLGCLIKLYGKHDSMILLFWLWRIPSTQKFSCQHNLEPSWNRQIVLTIHYLTLWQSPSLFGLCILVPPLPGCWCYFGDSFPSLPQQHTDTIGFTCSTFSDRAAVRPARKGCGIKPSCGRSRNLWRMDESTKKHTKNSSMSNNMVKGQLGRSSENPTRRNNCSGSCVTLRRIVIWQQVHEEARTKPERLFVWRWTIDAYVEFGCCGSMTMMMMMMMMMMSRYDQGSRFPMFSSNWMVLTRSVLQVSCHSIRSSGIPKRNKSHTRNYIINGWSEMHANVVHL